MKNYLDNCALGRQTDQQDQPRLVTERGAVQVCLSRLQSGTLLWSASAALAAEIAKNSNVVRRAYTASLLEFATEVLEYTPSIHAQAARFQALGFHFFDAQHLAFAIAAETDVLLTTDDRFIRNARRFAPVLDAHGRTEVINPVEWLRKSVYDHQRTVTTQ